MAKQTNQLRYKKINNKLITRYTLMSLINLKWDKIYCKCGLYRWNVRYILCEAIISILSINWLNRMYFSIFLHKQYDSVFANFGFCKKSSNKILVFPKILYFTRISESKFRNVFFEFSEKSPGLDQSKRHLQCLDYGFPSYC